MSGDLSITGNIPNQYTVSVVQIAPISKAVIVDLKTGAISSFATIPTINVTQPTPVGSIAVNIPNVAASIEVASVVGAQGPRGLAGAMGAPGGWQGFGSISVQSQILVGPTGTTLLAANSARRYAHIVNNSSVRVYIQFQALAIIKQGIPLQPGSLFSLSGMDLWLGAVTAVSSNGLVSIDVFEAV